MEQFELENRLVEFSRNVFLMAQSIEKDFAAQHLVKQLIRSGTSCALNYGEAQGAPTKKDFINKCSIVLKDLRETSINMKIIDQSGFGKENSLLPLLIDECGQLIGIFTKTIKTASRNLSAGR